MHYLTLRLKILYLFSIMSAITVMGGLMMLWHTYQTDDLIITMVQKEMVLFRAAQEMELALANQKGYLTYYFVDGQAKWLNSLGKYREMFRQSLDKARTLDLTPQQKESLETIAVEFKKYVEAKDLAIETYRLNPDKTAITPIHEQQRSVFFNLLDLCREFSQKQWQIIQETEWKNAQRSEGLRIMAYGALFFFTILSILLLFILYKHILEPIRDLAIETGSSPTDSSRDEVVSLSHSLKDMMKDFDETHSELARSRKNLIQAERMAMVGEMAAGVAHTIRNPFTSIKMRMFSLSRSLDLTDVQNEDLQVISDEIARIDKIVQNFLEFARPPKLKLTQCRIAAIIDGVITLLEYRLNAHGVELFFTPNPDLPQVDVDQDRIKEALVNLITNACEAMEQGGTIIITETRDYEEDMGDVARICIRDNGPGIPDSIINKITNPFFTTKEDGSGLGLSIVARIVREHNGKLAVSQAPDNGAEFTITLPVRGIFHESDTDH
ncbi:MAG: ATP-binding protein [Pseudomonadota bacterium]